MVTTLARNSILSHGSMRMPVIGLGTWQAKPHEIDTALIAAIDSGYRHIDTAFTYNNEEEIGRSLKRIFARGKLRREELFIVTKLPHIGNRYEDVGAYLRRSLEGLRLDYIDLYLVHSPVGFQKPVTDGQPLQDLNLDMSTNLLEIWTNRGRSQAMEEQVDEGRANYIGISKFNKSQIQRILNNCRIRPANLQTELHIYLQEEELVSFCQEQGITVCAFSALGSPGTGAWSDSSRPDLVPLEDPTIAEIARKYNKNPSHILLRYLLEYGVAVIPKSVNPTRIMQNIDVFDFKLSKEESDRISSLDRGEKGRILGSLFYPKQIIHPEFPYPK